MHKVMQDQIDNAEEQGAIVHRYLGVGAFAGRSTIRIHYKNQEIVDLMEDETGVWIRIAPPTDEDES